MGLSNIAAAAAALKKQQEPVEVPSPSSPPDDNINFVEGMINEGIAQTHQQSAGVAWPEINKNVDDLMSAIKTRRIALGWSQRELAIRSGMSQGTITRAECHGDISFRTTIRITIALGKQLIIG